MDILGIKELIGSDKRILSFSGSRYSLFVALCDAWNNKLIFARLSKQMLEGNERIIPLSETESLGLTALMELRDKWGSKRISVVPAAVEKAERGNAISVDDRFFQGLTKKIRADDVSFMKELSEKKLNVDLIDSDGTSLLSVASQSGSLKSILFLAKCGADLNIQDRAGNTALIWASASGKNNSARALLHFGADPFIRNFAGIGALTLALTRGNYPLADLLMEFGLTPSESDAHGNPLLHRALILKNRKMFDYLIECGASVLETNGLGQTVARLASGVPEFYDAIIPDQSRVNEGRRFR